MIGVESERLTVELDTATTGLVKAGASGVVPIGSINSYLTVPAGAMRVVAIVTAIRMRPDSDSKTSADQLRQIEATMVGRIENGAYSAGVSTYPSLYSPVSIATAMDIARIFRPGDGPTVMLGDAVVAPGQPVVLNANALLARHCAVLGSTGAGKSCTVTALIDGLLEIGGTSASIVIFDSNGEYAQAFKGERGKRHKVVVLGPEPGNDSGLLLPHWFMDNEDHIAFFRAREGAQAPLLQRAIADARFASGVDVGVLGQLRNVGRNMEDIRELSIAGGRKPQESLGNALGSLAGSLTSLKDRAIAAATDDLAIKHWTDMANAATQWTGMGLGAAWDVPVTLDQLNALDDILTKLTSSVESYLKELGVGDANAATDFDAPRYYSMQDLANIFLPNRIATTAQSDPRVKNYMVTLVLRIVRVLADSRYNFMTGVPRFSKPLSRFLRLLLGVDVLENLGAGDTPPPWGDAYKERNPDSAGHNVTVLDLSLIASDVLENVTALLGRMLLQFAQRVEPRAAFPMLLVLEEAHRYVPGDPNRESRSAVVFERIAKEGRKYGVSLLVASQRPSELSHTLLAQCGTVIAHRIVNFDDQELIRHATSAAGRDVLKQLPGLATQHAVVIGEAVAAPTYVRIRDVAEPPKSSDPDFVGSWKAARFDGAAALIDKTAAEWERATED